MVPTALGETMLVMFVRGSDHTVFTTLTLSDATYCAMQTDPQGTGRSGMVRLRDALRRAYPALNLSWVELSDYIHGPANSFDLRNGKMFLMSTSASQPLDAASDGSDDAPFVEGPVNVITDEGDPRCRCLDISTRPQSDGCPLHDQWLYRHVS